MGIKSSSTGRQKVLGGRVARALAYGNSVGFLSVRFLRFPKKIAKQDFLERGTATAQSCHRFYACGIRRKFAVTT